MANFFRSRSIGDYWDESKGRPLGFDNLRVLLAFAVILWHTIHVCYGRAAETWFWIGPLRPVVYFLVPSFFALSGFLVAGSLLRNDLLSFASLRLIRIYPALTLEVLLSALILGTALTQFDLSEYYSDSLFYKYFLNIVGWIHYELPGLFLENPGSRKVNAQLWTVPYELECYLLVIFAAMFGLHRRPTAFLASAVAITVAGLLYIVLWGTPPQINDRPPGKMIVLCFIFGVALFLLKDKIKINFLLFVVSIIIYSLIIYSRYGIYISPFFVAYATVYIGIQKNKLPLIGSLADYSYGIYLYGFPMQQAIAYLLPDYRIWWVNFILSSALSVAFAAFSWHFVEKRINDNKKSVVRRVLLLRDGLTGRISQSCPSKERR